MATDGINRLIAVTQLKSSNANDEAMIGADNQRKLISEQKGLRADLRTIETMMHSDKGISVAEEGKIAAMLTALNLDPGMAAGFKQGDNGIAEGGDADDAKANSANFEKIKGAMGDVVKDLEAKDKLGNVEINLIMSDYNQAETLASSVEKKKFDTLAAITSKI